MKENKIADTVENITMFIVAVLAIVYLLTLII